MARAEGGGGGVTFNCLIQLLFLILSFLFLRECRFFLFPGILIQSPFSFRVESVCVCVCTSYVFPFYSRRWLFLHRDHGLFFFPSANVRIQSNESIQSNNTRIIVRRPHLPRPVAADDRQALETMAVPLPSSQPRLRPGLWDLRKANDASPIAFRGGGEGTCSIITHEDEKLNATKGEVEEEVDAIDKKKG